MTESPDDYAYWRAALAGQETAFEADKPQCGFYFRRRGGRDAQAPRERDPVAIYPSEDGLVADVWSERTELTEELWLSVATHPITEEVYWDTRDNNRWADTVGLVEPKPEESSVPGANVPVTSNEPAEGIDPKETLDDQIRSAIRVLEEIIGKNPDQPNPITSQAVADRVANSKDRLKQLYDEADAIRAKEKKPHDDASKAVQLRWKPTLTTAEAARQRAIYAGTLWLKAERSRLEEEQKARLRKAEEERKAAEAAAKQAEAEGREPPPPPPDEPPAIIDTRPRAGGAISGRRTGLRETRVYAIVDDWTLLIDTLKQSDDFLEELKALAQQYADRAAKGGNPLAGTRRASEEKAV